MTGSVDIVTTGSQPLKDATAELTLWRMPLHAADNRGDVASSDGSLRMTMLGLATRKTRQEFCSVPAI
jgi:hypothetical protein